MWRAPADPDGRLLSRLARRNHPSDGAPLLQNYVININQIMAGAGVGWVRGRGKRYATAHVLNISL